MFIFTLTIIILVFLLDLTLSILNYKNRNQPIPANVADVYDKKEYKKWLDYTMEIFKNSILTKSVNTIVLIAFLTFGIFPKLATLSESLSKDRIIQTLIFFGLYIFISFILNIGFNLYKTFNIEERYGFNKTTVKTFITDKLKSALLLILLGGPLIYLILFLFLKLGVVSLFYTWFILISILLLVNILYTRVFIKLFNKLTPLPQGELYDATQKLARELGYEIKTIAIMDASKRSSRLNAFFSGFGKFKSIILFDTLVEKCTTDQIISVLAHEIGHSKNKDVLRNFIVSSLQMAIYLFLLSFFLLSSEFALAFGFDSIHLGFAFILFGILLEPIGIVLNIPLSAISRKAEYKADKIAKVTGYKDALISSLKILGKENFTNLTPHPLVVKLTYTHPPVTQRIEALNKD